jgi:DNA repair protein RecN (Recombination protein N)
MLQLLRIKNLAIVSELEIDFETGLTVITGETGAGKSLILKGLELLRGGKASTDLIRAGQQKGEVEALFVLDAEARNRTLAELHEHYDWVDEVFAEDEVVLRRVIDGTGRGKITINSRLSTRAELEAVSSALFDITGQHSQQRLLDRKFHLFCLDQFGVSKGLLEEAKQKFVSWNEIKRRLDKARADSSSNQEITRRLKFEVEELTDAELRVEEKEDLEGLVKRASSVETLSTGVSELLNILDGETEEGVVTVFDRVLTSLAKLRKVDSTLESVEALADSVSVQLGELRAQLENYLQKLEIDPELIEGYRARLSQLSKLERKYGKNIVEIISYLAEITKELALHEGGAYDLDLLAKQEREAKVELSAVEERLTKERKEVSVKLASEIESRLVALEMKRAKFSVKIEAGKSSELGADEIEFLLAANPGEPSNPLAEVASGGELSRVLLVLKTLLNEQTTPVLQIFDEIDVGVGGATAQVIGEQIKKLSRRFQVLVVTHAPQVAALADHHLVVSKELSESRTNVSLKTLDKNDRVMEIARMLAGREVSDQFLRSAEALIGEASESKPTKAKKK